MANFQPDVTDFQIPVTTIKNTRVVSTGNGSLVPVSSVPQFTRGCVIKAKKSNTGSIYVGSGNVNSNNGLELSPGEPLSLGINDLSILSIFFDSVGDEARVIFGS